MWEKTRTPTPTSSYALANPGLSCFTPVRHSFPGPRRPQIPALKASSLAPSKPPANILSKPHRLHLCTRDIRTCLYLLLVKLARYGSSFSTRRHAGGSHFLVLQGHAPEEREGHCGCLGRVKGTIPQ